MPLLAPIFAWLGGVLTASFSWLGTFLLAAGGAFLASSIVPMAKKVLIGLGFGFVVFQGVDILLSQAGAVIKSSLSSLPVDMVSILAWLQIDSMISIILSAYAVRLALTLGANSGLLRKV